jgi:hypothetical protein
MVIYVGLEATFGSINVQKGTWQKGRRAYNREVYAGTGETFCWLASRLSHSVALKIQARGSFVQLFASRRYFGNVRVFPEDHS